ncbi:hypothetical protein J5N97_028199 [Dioscorea zingiberensis]|uniref:Uncharacterized protein n=1 Tax=Dioscorea zingiberensis TaxID=325984 RepID=A0A9D5H4J8_9LILI|nr:hypothetical protein J5N97_028199 [Dioscorea zingiberensis]
MVEDGEPSMSRGKGKQKRPPQRGLGVAQLEKIRLEEQHKNSNAAASSSSSPPPPPPPPPPPCTQPLLPLPLNPIVDLSSPPSFPNHPAGISGPRGFLAQWIDHRPDGNPLGLISSCPSLPRVWILISRSSRRLTVL